MKLITRVDKTRDKYKIYPGDIITQIKNHQKVNYIVLRVKEEGNKVAYYGKEIINV